MSLHVSRLLHISYLPTRDFWNVFTTVHMYVNIVTFINLLYKIILVDIV